MLLLTFFRRNLLKLDIRPICQEPKPVEIITDSSESVDDVAFVRFKSLKGR